MFIRIKKINGKQYAYLVNNTWKKRKKASRQKTLQYIGRVIKLEKKSNARDGEDENIKSEPPQKIIKFLVEKELMAHGFILQKNTWVKDGIKINLAKKEVKDQDNKDICLEMNNNFLCNYTIRKLLYFSPKGGLTKIEVGKELAIAFEAAGIPIPKDLFVFLFQKIISEIEKTH